MQVEIFIPCFIDQLFPQTGMNMVKILKALDCDVHYNTNQTCCGQPAYNSGFYDDSREVAVKCMKDLSSSADYIVMPSASCAGMMKNAYQDLFKGTTLRKSCTEFSKKVYEFSDFVVNKLGVHKIPGATLTGKATYHDSCSALRECRLKSEPRKLLQNVEGLELEEMEATSDCCGFGGSFAVKFEAISIGMGDQKVSNAMQTGADYLISTDSSCLMHLGGYIDKQNKPIKPMHIVDVLASGW